MAHGLYKDIFHTYIGTYTEIRYQGMAGRKGVNLFVVLSRGELEARKRKTIVRSVQHLHSPALQPHL